MAMTMSGEQQLAAPRETVWAKLNDPEVLKACIPGCESLDRLGENEFQAVATNRVGPVKARFKGKVRLTDLDPPNGYKISCEGDGGIAGFAKGGASDAGMTWLQFNLPVRSTRKRRPSAVPATANAPSLLQASRAGAPASSVASRWPVFSSR